MIKILVLRARTQRSNTTLEHNVLNNSRRCSISLVLLHIFGTKQKLSIQIGNLDLVIIRDGDETLTVAVMTSYTHHGEILDEFAAQGSHAHNEPPKLCDPPLYGLAEDNDLPVVAPRRGGGGGGGGGG